VTESNKDEIVERIAALQQRHGGAPVEREEPPFELPPELFRTVAETARTGSVDSGYVWVRRTPDQFPDPSASSPDSAATTRPRVLLIYHRADDHLWTVPGGEREPDESLEETARRELREETGIEATIAGLRKIRHNIAVPTEPVDAVEFDEVHAAYPVFDARYAGGELDVQLSELYGAAWFDRMPDSVHRLIADQSLAGDPTTG
jgi:8-oxo-dGTP diphosphatase